jgi:hypothetical protein
MGRRSRSRSPRDKKSKRRSPSANSSEDKHVTRGDSGKRSKLSKAIGENGYSIQTRSKFIKNTLFSGRKNSEVIPHGSSHPKSKHENPEQQSNPGDFSNFDAIHKKTVECLIKRGIVSLFPVQYMSFTSIYDREDLIVRDLTGSGKTLGFALPTVEYLRANNLFGTGKIQSIILAPTRELALQITRVLADLKHHEKEYSVLTVYGGVSIDE